MLELNNTNVAKSDGETYHYEGPTEQQRVVPGDHPEGDGDALDLANKDVE